MKTLFRILGTAAVVAVTGAAIVALDKILNQKDPLHVEEVEFPEDAELDPKEAEKAAEAYAEGEAKAADEANAEAAAAEAPEAAAEAYAEGEAKAADEANAEAAAAEAPEAAAEPAAQPAEEAAAPAAPAEGGEKPVCDPEAPNPNPVEAGPAVAPKDASGKFDPTKIAEASDFGDWEEQGCKG